MSAETTRDKPPDRLQVSNQESQPGDTPSQPGRYVLLIRHAARARKWRQSEAAHPVKGLRPIEDWANYEAEFPFTDFKPGLSRTCGLTGQLCDELEAKKFEVSEILCSTHTVATQTADIVAKVLKLRKRYAGSREFPGVPVLTPGKTKQECEHKLIEELIDFGDRKNRKQDSERYLKFARDNAGTANLAIILIGHQPQLTIIARALLDPSLRTKGLPRFFYKLRNIFPNNSLPANVLPLGNSEIACIQLGPHPRLLWLLTEKSNELLVELKAKIASKYDVAKFFLGALVVGTGLTLSETIWKLSDPMDKLLAGCGAFAALVSLGLTAATLFSYDRLLMPAEFWSEEGNGPKPLLIVRWLAYLGSRVRGKPPRWTVSRPPSQAHMNLFYEMVHTWTHFFIPAIVSAFTALGLMVVAMADNSTTEVSGILHIQAEWRLLILLGLALLAFIIGLIAFYFWKPRLGFDD
ncbi:MAG: hypothetical protein QOI77_1476 [Blastocatellia bacterium]|nr:hypothetical protein [Blastocatellia bacterium]